MGDSKQAIRSLYNILKQERSLGFNDGAVIGGLDSFLQRSAADLDPILGRQQPYGSLSPEERSLWADRVVRTMRGALAREVGPPTRPAEPRSPTPRAANGSVGEPRAADRSLRMSDDIAKMKGMWRNTLTRLRKLGVETVGDLVYLFPSRHNDFSGG